MPSGLRLTERQRQALVGTTVEELPALWHADVDLMVALGAKLPGFADTPLKKEEALTALGVALREALWVEPPAEGTAPLPLNASLVLAPLPELLQVQRHPNMSIAAPLKRVISLRSAPGVAPLLAVIARRDMHAGEEALPLWLGRFSSSELALRRDEIYSNNPVGVGGKFAPPQNLSPNRNTPHMREYRKFNCSSGEAFEMRLSPKGWPMRPFIRCARIAHFLATGAYKPGFVDRMDMLDKWPPPKKYAIEEWLSWTQADQTVNRQLHAYCVEMKKQLKETITSRVADDFRQSTDATDILVWKIRSDETKAFRECVALSRSISTTETG